MERDWDMENSFLCWWQQHLPFRDGAGDGIQRGVVSVVYGFWGIEWWSRCQPSFVLAFIMGL